MSGTFTDRMDEGDSQLMQFTVRSANLTSSERHILVLRIAGAGLIVEPPNGYRVPITDGEKRYVFSVSANGTGEKAGLVYAELLSGLDTLAGAAVSSDGFGLEGNFPLKFIVDADTTFGLRQGSWTVINIVVLISITVIAGLSAFAARTVVGLWNLGWKLADNWERVQQFLKTPRA